MSKDFHPARKKFTRFSSSLPFEFGMPNANPKLKQTSDGSPLYFTRASSLLRRQVLENAPSVKIKSDSFLPRVLKREKWSSTDFSNQKVLFLIPSDALGDCVGMALFMRAFVENYPNAELGVLNSASASDIFMTVPGINIFQLFISSRQMTRFTHIIDLSEMEGWEKIAEMPVNTEETLCQAFGIEPIAIERRTKWITSGAKIGVVPMASAPLRTLPPELVKNVIGYLSRQGFQVSVLLNAYQGLMPSYKAALSPADFPNVTFLDGFQTTGQLVEFVKTMDYMVLADSGPAHISKLFQTLGIAIYTSASGKTLQGRHSNLRIWQSRYTGEWCQAPCGLAKLRSTSDGRIGCMGSLELPIDKLTGYPSLRNVGLAEKFTLVQPVPCVAQLKSETQDILDFLGKDLG